MNNFKWNRFPSTARFWDCTNDSEEVFIRSDKEIVSNPNQVKFEDALNALCRVVSELIEIEEERSKS